MEISGAPANNPWPDWVLWWTLPYPYNQKSHQFRSNWKESEDSTKFTVVIAKTRGSIWFWHQQWWRTPWAGVRNSKTPNSRTSRRPGRMLFFKPNCTAGGRAPAVVQEGCGGEGRGLCKAYPVQDNSKGEGHWEKEEHEVENTSVSTSSEEENIPCKESSVENEGRGNSILEKRAPTVKMKSPISHF